LPQFAQAFEISRVNGVACHVSLQPHYQLIERHEFDQLTVVLRHGIGVME
jgi:aryl-alcohol dehydrogenase-like predicted oxidoreductase